MGDSMSSIVVSGDTSGAITLQAPAVAGTNTLNLPASTGTLALTGAAVTSSQLPAGTVLQVVSATTNTIVSTTSTTRNGTATGLTATITPKSSTSKILVIWTLVGSGGSGGSGYANLLRNGSTELAIGSGGSVNSTGRFYGGSYVDTLTQAISGTYLDSPATTSATTYAFYFWTQVATAYINRSNYNPDGGAVSSSITLMEIAA